MRQGIYTSGFFHLFGGFLLLANFQLLENNSNEVLNKVSVKLLSEQELIELAEREKTRAKEVESFQPRTITDLNTNPKKIAIPPKINAGNEIKGLTEPNIIKIKKRKTSDEIITEHAQRGDDDVEKQVEKKSNRTVQKNDLPEKSNNDQAKQKNTSSQISSEGENVEIVSGALKIAKLPLLKPNFVEQSDPNDLKKTIPTKSQFMGDQYR